VTESDEICSLSLTSGSKHDRRDLLWSLVSSCSCKSVIVGASVSSGRAHDDEAMEIVEYAGIADDGF